MNHCHKERRLVRKTMVERALGDARAPCDRLDAGRAVAMREEKVGRDIEDPFAEPLRVSQGWTPAAARWSGAMRLLLGARPRLGVPLRARHPAMLSTAAVVRIGLVAVVRHVLRRWHVLGSTRH